MIQEVQVTSQEETVPAHGAGRCLAQIRDAAGQFRTWDGQWRSLRSRLGIAFCLGGGEGEGREPQRSLRVKACSREERPSGGSAEEEQSEFRKETFSVSR